MSDIKILVKQFKNTSNTAVSVTEPEGGLGEDVTWSSGVGVRRAPHAEKREKERCMKQ